MFNETGITNHKTNTFFHERLVMSQRNNGRNLIQVWGHNNDGCWRDQRPLISSTQQTWSLTACSCFLFMSLMYQATPVMVSMASITTSYPSSSESKCLAISWNKQAKSRVKEGIRLSLSKRNGMTDVPVNFKASLKDLKKVWWSVPEAAGDI